MSSKKDRIWLRQPNETVRDYQLFEKYLNLGVGRSLEQLAKAQGRKKVPDAYRILYENNNWEERAAAYDEFILQEHGKKRAFTSDKIHDELTSVAQKFLDKVNQRLETMDPQSLTPADVKNWVDAIVKVQKLSSEMGLAVGSKGKAPLTTTPLVEVVVRSENSARSDKKPQIIAANAKHVEVTEDDA